MENCEVCGNFAALKCSGCSLKFYCSKEHQKVDWKNVHKHDCKSYEIAKNDILGRFMVAKRNIKAGDVIVREPPLVLGPKISSIVMCLGCHRTINPPKSGDYFKCSGCTWPLCGSSCESLPAHVEECQLMRQKKFNSSIKNCGAPKIEAAYCVITPLRVILLKKTNPKAFKTIMELTSNLDQRIDTKLYGALRVNLVPFIRSFLGLTDFTETDVLNIAGILDTNTFDVVLPAKQTRLRGIYPISAMLAGGCVPNTKHFVDENFEMKVIACVPIKKGEMILTSYTHPLKTTIERKHQIREAKCFDCICPRCNDPSEMKTFVSGVRCKSCSVGIQVPVDLIRWQCSECFKEISSKEATEILKNARSSLEALNKKSIADCEKFLRSFLVVLPPTSVFMIDVKYSLSLLYGNVSGFMIEDLSAAQLDRKLELCDEIIDVLSVLEPGISNSVLNTKVERSSAKIALTKMKHLSGGLSREEAEGVIDSELKDAVENFGILMAGSEGKALLETRLKRIIAQSSLQ